MKTRSRFFFLCFLLSAGVSSLFAVQRLGAATATVAVPSDLRKQAEQLQPQTFTPFGKTDAFAQLQQLGIPDNAQMAATYYQMLADAILGARFATDTTGERLRMVETVCQPVWAIAIGSDIVLRGHHFDGVDPRTFFGDKIPQLVITPVPREVFAQLALYGEGGARATPRFIGDKPVGEATLDEYIAYVRAINPQGVDGKSREQHEADLQGMVRSEADRSIQAYRAIGLALNHSGWEPAQREALRAALLTQNYDIELRPLRRPGFMRNSIRLTSRSFAPQSPDALARLLAPQTESPKPVAPANPPTRAKKGRMD